MYSKDSLPHWEPGTVAGGRYRIVRLLGSGGMGVVYAAEDMKLERKLRALKAIKAAAEDRQRSSEEAQVLMKLSHPNLPSIVDYAPPDEQGVEWFVMDFVSGQTVRQLVADRGAGIRFEEAAAIGMQLCSALSYLHRQSPPIIHRDLKPSNVMIDERGLVKLIDFGIARLYKPGAEQDTVLLGTPGFAAPEQSGGGQSGEWTDVYGLGALLFYMLSGGVTNRVAVNRPFGPDVPRAFVRVLDRMLAKDPYHRYSSMEQVLDALRAFVPVYTADSIAASEHTVRRSGKACTIAVLGLSEGAGATFMAISIAKLLARQGLQVAAAEFPGVRPEWHSLLDPRGGSIAAKRRQPEHAGMADERYRLLQGADRVHWHMLQPAVPRNEPPRLHAFEREIARLPSDVTVVDVSGAWDHSGHEVAGWLQEASLIVIAADPFVSRWEARKLSLLERLAGSRAQAGLRTLWAANKDTSFRGRKEWQQMLPDPIVFPQLDTAAVLEAIWAGGWCTDNSAIRRAADKALAPLWHFLSKELGAKKGSTVRSRAERT
ncbi:serine/threonine-protein kinase [Paenibacillus protaetiae]|uniref:Serine/threonine protein kinase n=1 Tax=Paenibacillus protaetiae TaxID=2509456 RepID=A0A4P6EU84_9BACL|nr:serine/threonine-protein kinase [Paenibacillus protaetiae]QAY66035.1 serine/threonine protein kinase [Paenibacillus protaetiae]